MRVHILGIKPPDAKRDIRIFHTYGSMISFLVQVANDEASRRDHMKPCSTGEQAIENLDIMGFEVEWTELPVE